MDECLHRLGWMPGCGRPGAYGRCPCHVLTLRVLATAAAPACAPTSRARGLPVVRGLAGACGCVSASGCSGKGEAVPLWSDVHFPDDERRRVPVHVPLGPVWFFVSERTRGRRSPERAEALCREARRRPRLAAGLSEAPVSPCCLGQCSVVSRVLRSWVRGPQCIKHAV